MGVNLKELIIKKPIELDELSGKVLVIDAFNMLYQFLTTIRQRDGSLLTDSEGRVTSHLIGLLSRTTNTMPDCLNMSHFPVAVMLLCAFHLMFFLPSSSRVCGSSLCLHSFNYLT